MKTNLRKVNLRVDRKKGSETAAFQIHFNCGNAGLRPFVQNQSANLAFRRGEEEKGEDKQWDGKK